MAKFIVRVELHNAVGSGPYNILHAEMEKLGFIRTITATDGTGYDLPTAMYFGTAPEGWKAQKVRDYAQPAAEATGLRYWILAIQYENCAWLLHPTTL